MSGPAKCSFAELKAMVQMCIAQPSILHHPDMAPVKALIEHFGGKIPEQKPNDSPKKAFETESKAEEPEESESKPEPESEESDLELDMTGVIEPDTDAPQKMGNLTLQPTEEEIAESQAKRSEAVSAFVEKDYERAIQLYTEAIVLNPQASLLYAKRGQVFLLLNKPNACIRDCHRALELNPDSAAAHKFRGRANYLLGNWEEAANDLRLACKFDFDEQADEWLREVTPNARKIEEHKRKRERRAQQKIHSDKKEKLKKPKETPKTQDEPKNPFQGQPGGGPKDESFYDFFNDPAVEQACLDPEVRMAFLDISADFKNIFKYVNNPKIRMLVQKCKIDVPGFTDTRTPEETPTEQKIQDDVNLD